MKKQLCKIFSLVFCVIVIFSSFFVVPSQAAENDFSMKAFDKAYITFIFDDGRMPFTEECFELFQRFNVPMTCALVANRVKSDLDLFLQIQEAGGEIYSHTYSHNALTASTSTAKNIEKELGDSYRVLTGLGFDINGVIETGNGGGEKTANYELIETISRKYYKYSNAYGVSPQYNMKRTTLSGKDLNTVINLVNDAINNKKHLTLWAHDFKEFSKSNMTELLDYIDAKGKSKVEVVTWNYIYNKFGRYTGPQVPTAEAIKSVCDTQGHVLKNPVIDKAATCSQGPVMKGECKLCGKTATRQSETGALGHKFENYVSDNNAGCNTYATKTAKCSYDGCKKTDTVVDYDSRFKHDIKLVTIKEATATTDGLAQKKCSLCGYSEGTVVIPKGQNAEDIVLPEDSTTQEEQDTSNINLPQGGKSAKMSTGLIVILATALSILIAALGILVFFVVKKFKS